MINQHPLSKLARLGTLYAGAQLQMVREAMLAGNTAGQLWMLGQGQQSALLWDQGNNVLYLGGEELDAETVTELHTLVTEKVQPAAVRAGARYFRARGLTPSLDAALPALFPGVNLSRTTKRFYVYPAAEPPEAVQPAAPGLALVPIDREFLQAEREYRHAVIGEIAWMWPGPREQAVAHFLEHGLGSAAVVDGRIVCWCTAEYVSARRCGIGIETLEAYQRRGVATATTAHFIAAALHRGLTPHWECDSANLPSIRVAEKAGFRPLEEAEFWVGIFPAT